MCLRGGGGRDAAGCGSRRRPARADARPPGRRRTAGAGTRLGRVLRNACRGHPGRVRPAPPDRVPGRARRTAPRGPHAPGRGRPLLRDRGHRDGDRPADGGGAARRGCRPRRGRLRSSERHDGRGPRRRSVRRPAGGPTGPGRPARGERAVRAHRRDSADATRGAASREPHRSRRGSRRPRSAPSCGCGSPGVAATRGHDADRDQPGPGSEPRPPCAQMRGSGPPS